MSEITEVTEMKEITEQAPVNYAGFWIRFVALVIDTLVLSFLSFLLIIPLLGLIGLSSLNFSDLSSMDEEEIVMTILAISTPLYLANAIMTWLYYALLQSGPWQATLGKRAVGVKVVDKNGDRVSFTTASVRYLGRIISGMTMLIGWRRVTTATTRTTSRRRNSLTQGRSTTPTTRWTGRSSTASLPVS